MLPVVSARDAAASGRAVPVWDVSADTPRVVSPVGTPPTGEETGGSTSNNNDGGTGGRSATSTAGAGGGGAAAGGGGGAAAGGIADAVGEGGGDDRVIDPIEGGESHEAVKLPQQYVAGACLVVLCT